MGSQGYSGNESGSSFVLLIVLFILLIIVGACFVF
ncbi:MAG: YjcZ family sporulation protein [Lysinibacillus sp.]